MYKNNGNAVKEYYNLEEPNADNINEKVEHYINSKLRDLKFSYFMKNAVISLIALVISFFLDISAVPILGNISITFSKFLFPAWQPINESIKPLSFWWLPVVTYCIFMLFAYKSYRELREKIKHPTSPEIIDRIVGSSISVTDGIATALPLIGAAILLISIKLGPEIFLGLSVPFEIKSLAILAIGKLFEPFLDSIGVEFQHISHTANDMKNMYNMSQMLKLNGNPGYLENRTIDLTNALQSYSSNELEKLEFSLKKVTDYTSQILTNLTHSSEVLNEIINAGTGTENKIFEIKEVTMKVIEAANSLKDEKTLLALKSLEAIVNRG